MDRFESSLRAETIDLVERMGVDRRALAISRIGLFAATLYRLLVERREAYCALVTAGTSGLYMRELTRMVFDLLGLEMPPAVSLPILRRAPDGAFFDNTPLLPEVRRQLGDTGGLERILFVDDEIKRGTTAHACCDLLLRGDRVATDRPLSCTIVAENHFFEWPWDQPRIAVRYVAPARLLYGLEHNIAYCLPPGLVEEARLRVDPEIGHHELLALVVGGAVKRLRGGVPFYDETPARSLARGIPGYPAVRRRLRRDLEAWIDRGLRRYRDGEISFRL